MISRSDERRALDRWARDRGWSDFDTFIRVGGSIAEACEDIDHRIAMLEDARVALGRYGDNEREDVPQHHSARSRTIATSSFSDALTRLTCLRVFLYCPGLKEEKKGKEKKK